MRAQKKPVVIEYWQVTDLDIDDKVPAWIFNAMADYIIKGIHGELYPCKPDIFKKTYDLLD